MRVHVHGRQSSVRKIEDREATVEGLYSCKVSRGQRPQEALSNTWQDVTLCQVPAFFCSIRPRRAFRDLWILPICPRDFRNPFESSERHSTVYNLRLRHVRGGRSSPFAKYVQKRPQPSLRLLWKVLRQEAVLYTNEKYFTKVCNTFVYKILMNIYKSIYVL